MIRSTPRTPYDYTPCPYCKSGPDSACHDRHGFIRPPHRARIKEFYNQQERIAHGKQERS